MDPRTTVLASVLAPLLLGGPASGGGGKDGRRLPAGQWGGPHLEMEVTEAGARLELDCARGSIGEPLNLDAGGRFDLKGTYVQEQPGPEREGEGQEGAPARYKGRVEGKTMTLTITLLEGDRSVGTYTLTRGKRGRLWKCL